MIGASRPKQNYAMHRQLSDFERYIQRADNLFSIDRLYRELKCIVPQNQTVNSLQALRQVVHRAPRSTHRRISNIFFKTFFEYVDYLRRLSRVFKERIHTVLFDFFYDTMFIRLQDIEAKSIRAKKSKSSKKEPGQDLSPEVASEVGELCQQLSCTVDGIEETISSWGKLLEDTEIDSTLFDASSEHNIALFKDCKRFQGILRLVPDVLNKSRMAVIFARAWWYKAEKIRRKLGQKSESGSDWSSPDTDLPSIPKTVPKNKRQKEKTAVKDQPMTQPAVFRRKIKKVNSFEELDAERTELVKPKRGPLRKPAYPDGRSEQVLEKPDVGNQGAKQQEEQPENGKSFPKRTIPKKQSKFPSHQANPDRSRRMNQKMGETNPVSNPDDAGPGADEEPKPHNVSQRPRKARPVDQNPSKGTQRNKVKPFPPTLKDHVHAGKDKSESETLDDEQLVESQTTNQASTVTKERNPNRSKQLEQVSTTVRGKKQKQNENQNSGDTVVEDKKNTKQKPLVSHNRNNKKGSNEQHGQKQHPGENIPTKKTNRSKDGQKQQPEEYVPTKKIHKPKNSSFQTRKAKDHVNPPPLTKSNKYEIEGEQSDLDNLTWPEKKLEKLRQKFDEAIEGKEIQHAAFKLMVGQKENLVRDIEKYQGYYRHNRILKARVILLIGKAREWKEENKLLDYQCRLLKEDLELEMQIDASFISSNDELQDKIDVLATMVENERMELRQLERDLGFMKQATIHRGIPYDSDFDDLLEYGNLKRYGYRYKALGGSLRPSRNLRLLPWNADPFLGKSLQSQYEKSTWRSMESLSSLCSSLGFSYGGGTEDETGGDSGFTRDSDDPDLNFNEKPGVKSKQAAVREDTGERLKGAADGLKYEEDSSSDSEDNTQNYPRIYDRKREEPPFIPV